MKAQVTAGMVRTALFLKPEQTARLQMLSDLTGAPMAELIRRAIDAYLESRKAEIRGK
jgi:predicted DNA-binding protein